MGCGASFNWSIASISGRVSPVGAASAAFGALWWLGGDRLSRDVSDEIRFYGI